MRILVAPDKFKDALDARGVAEAIASGVRDALPLANVICCPLGDGGEGSAALLAAARGGEPRAATVLDPLGRPRTARWYYVRSTSAGIVEMAEASGLQRLQPVERNPLYTSSFGTGQLIRAAIDAGCSNITLCVGGSATVDGGAGCLQALGWRLLDARGQALAAPIAGGQLQQVARIVPPAEWKVAIELLCDVDNPLLGSRGAAPCFARQKGAAPDQVRLLDDGLAQWADLLERATGRDVRTVPHGGAAGGLPAGLMAAAAARALPGFGALAEGLGLERVLAGCELCLTGEGRIDAQTAGGKVVAGVARLAGANGVPVVAFTGALDARDDAGVRGLAQALGLRDIVVISTPGVPLEAALADTGANLRMAVVRYFATRQ